MADTAKFLMPIKACCDYHVDVWAWVYPPYVPVPQVCLDLCDVSEKVSMSAPEARELAAALIQAAEAIESA